MLLVAALVGALMTLTPLGQLLGRSTDDLQLHWLAPAHQSDQVLVFDIDDDSLAVLQPQFGNWPYQRDVYALAIDVLREAGARAIAIDLLLADREPADAALARALARPGAPVVLAAAALQTGTDQVAPLQALAGSAVLPAAAEPPARIWPALALPAASTWQGGPPPRFGVITTPLDSDGVLRSLPAWHQDARARLPTMPLALHLMLKPDAPPVQLDEHGNYRLLMPAPALWPRVLPFTELAAVARGQGDATALRAAVAGRVVFIGSSALLADTVMTTRGQASGTEVLAQIYSTMAKGQDALPHDRRLDFALLLLALIPAALAVMRGRVKPSREATTTGLVTLVLAAVALSVLLVGRQPTAWLPPLATLAAGLAMAMWLFQRDQTAARQRLARELDIAAATAKAKAAFLANVSHEIRTPLNALLGVSELLAATPLDAQQRLHVQVFREAGQNLHALINDLLDLSKVEAGRLEIHPAPFDLRHMLEQLVRLLRMRADDKGITLTLEISPLLAERVVGDRMRLEQALTNLVGNAIKFTQRGEVIVLAMPDPDDRKLLRFDVKDTGIGIAASKLDTVFEPFSQADGSVTRIYGGTGLGLSITRSLMALMGGTVQLQSTPGMGSTFTLRLPLPTAPPPALPESGPGQAGAATSPAAALGEPTSLPDWMLQAGPLPVLLAEDNEVNAYIFRAMLQDLKLDLHHATNGPAALDLLQRRDFALAFIDVQMPGMDGLTVTRELRRLEIQGARLRTPIVALTANAFPSDVQASLDAGCDHHLPKPFTREMLVGAIVRLARPPAAAGPLGAGAGTSLRAVLNPRAADERVRDDTALQARMREHALVFLSDWDKHFEQALRDEQPERAHRLAHDLNGIAGSIGAHELAAHAQALERSLWKAEPGQAPDAQAHANTLAVLPGVIAALSVEDPA